MSVMPLASIETRYEHIVIDERGIMIVARTEVDPTPMFQMASGDMTAGSTSS